MWSMKMYKTLGDDFFNNYYVSYKIMPRILECTVNEVTSDSVQLRT